jgi:hypothetical protein
VAWARADKLSLLNLLNLFYQKRLQLEPVVSGLHGIGIGIKEPGHLAIVNDNELALVREKLRQLISVRFDFFF